MLRNYMQGMTRVLALAGVVVGLGALGSGCLDRDVVAGAPLTKTNFTNTVSQSGIDKVDILFDIDNSASMGDKQTYLVQAIPQMISRLVTPNCVNATGGISGTFSSTTPCPTGYAAEFQPVHDMHLGVVTSALGSRGGIAAQSGGVTTPLCDPTATITSMQGGYTVSEYNDDEGHLINRTGPNGHGAAIAEAMPSSFLYWFPPNAANGMPTAGANPIVTSGAAGTPDTLVGDFTELVGGAGQSGCGIESQLESWYRFLIQPDPYDSIAVSSSNVASWVGVDSTIIQQRHDFLRPDSLVAIIVLTDENDSEIDVRSLSQSGHYFLSQTYNPYTGSTACSALAPAGGPASNPATGPGSAACKACAFTPTAPGCGPTYTNDNDWAFNLNLRHAHMMAKYGLDPQFPLTRYYNGLTSKTVPNRNGEYPVSATGSMAGSYVGTNNCTNPLFAASLPTAADATLANITPGTGALCNMPQGTRGAEDVFYAHIGGVPHQLLQSQPGVPDPTTMQITCPAGTAQADCPQKDQLSPSDWVKILGSGPASYTGAGGPLNYDYSGIDPHMIESYLPRTQLSMQNPNQAPATNPAITTLSGPSFTTNPFVDPINGREWVTNTGSHSLPVDRQYACVFQLPTTPTNLQRDCSTLGSATNTTLEYNSCDCTGTGDSNTEVPPLCAKTSSDGSITSSVNDYTVQVYAKAYPTIRELMLANMMQGQGIVSSLCPIHTEEATPGDPLYGYRPAVNAIVNRLKSALAAQCVPALTPDAKTGDVPCLILVTFDKMSATPPASESACSTYGTVSGTYIGPGETSMLTGAVTLPTNVLQQFQANQHAQWLVASKGDAGAVAAGTDPSTEITCALANQISATTTSCAGNSLNGWCYVTGQTACASTGGDALVFTNNNFIPNGATVSLQCIAASTAGDGG